jgi:hypothetical protein
VNQAHTRFGHLVYTRVNRKSATQFRVPLDRFIGEPGEGEIGKAHLISVIGGDTQIAALHAAISGGDAFTVETPERKRCCASLGANAECYRGSLKTREMARPLRHLIAVSEEMAAMGPRARLERTILLDDSPSFLWAALVELHGVPGSQEWGPWITSELRLRRRIESLQGIGCNPVLVKATRATILACLRRGLKRKQIEFPQENGPGSWPPTSLAKLLTDVGSGEV